MDELYTERLKALLHQEHEIKSLLAEALGYSYSEEHGWLMGDHTAVSLAREVQSRMKVVEHIPDDSVKDKNGLRITPGDLVSWGQGTMGKVLGVMRLCNDEVKVTLRDLTSGKVDYRNPKILTVVG